MIQHITNTTSIHTKVNFLLKTTNNWINYKINCSCGNMGKDFNQLQGIQINFINLLTGG